MWVRHSCPKPLTSILDFAENEQDECSTVEERRFSAAIRREGGAGHPGLLKRSTENCRLQPPRYLNSMWRQPPLRQAKGRPSAVHGPSFPASLRPGELVGELPNVAYIGYRRER